ncbi:protein of unknown function [Selenomonas ruminantium]|uniref:DUF370 domain-containing protein n=1 Tax=Selenomonas ruminantium TaxID=971 RepID=A0A1M6S303_SELRU|nr:extracellular matrix/biofilm biosynthesis regulator RemA family protein [Selenomonas ruminantium]SHK39050.1 protein of unknown function [Selenomonas ruminantium]
MFLHLGNGISVRTKDVIAIHDYSLFIKGKGSEFLANEQKIGRLENTLPLTIRNEEGAKKSLVITDDKTYLSAISPWTLKRRSQMVYDTMDMERDVPEDENGEFFRNC